MQTLGNMPFLQVGPFHYIVRLPVPPQPAAQPVVASTADAGMVRLGGMAPTLAPPPQPVRPPVSSQSAPQGTIVRKL